MNTKLMKCFPKCFTIPTPTVVFGKPFNSLFVYVLFMETKDTVRVIKKVTLNGTGFCTRSRLTVNGKSLTLMYDKCLVLLCMRNSERNKLIQFVQL